jgi:hypothetical protein
MARLRNAPSAPLPTTNATATKTRAALREKTNTTKTTRAKAAAVVKLGPDDLIKDAERPRRGRGKAAAQDDTTLIMAGGLGPREAAVEVENELATRVSECDNIMTTDELAKSDGPPLAAGRLGKRPPRMTRKPVRNEAQSTVLDGLKQRMVATARGEIARGKLGRSRPEAIETSSDLQPAKPVTKRKSAACNVERSEFSISPSPPPPGKLSSIHKRTSVIVPGSALRVHGTPAGETSILALKNFKRRPRQGSMLAMVQQRTASVRPSLAAGHQQEESSIFDLEDVSDDNEDFAPQAEGTPLQLSKAKKQASAKRKQTPAKVGPTANAASTRKRKSDGLDSSHSALDALRNKRQKSDAVVVEDDPLPLLDDEEPEQVLSSDRQRTPQLQATSDVHVLDSSPGPSSTPPTEPSSSDKRPNIEYQDFAIPSTEEQERQIEDDREAEDELAEALAPNATLAEPASSPEGSPISGTQNTDVFADPLTQFTPPPQRPAKETEKPKGKAVSTAILQSLLPKRRQRAQPRAKRTEYDISSGESEDEDVQLDASHLAQDEDELGGKLRRRKSKTTPAKSKKTKARPSKAPLSTSKRAKAAAVANTSKTTRTYGKKGKQGALSDNENEIYDSAPEEDDTTTLLDNGAGAPTPNKSRELEAARKKFEEVDDWDMSFESMSAEDHRSSSQGWR